MAKAPAATGAKKLKAPSKSEVLIAIAEETNVPKKDVAAVLDALTTEIQKAMSSRGPGMFQIPGLVKITRKSVPARPAQKNVPNPFKPGEFMDRPAKPASKKVKVIPLKNLKAMV
ncbi:MAG: DNA-binding protein [Planctomycetia bacterium 21-64-5]|nr:MAG: DNA-binding protein [Planctomycetia bacterium 21-64-5]HQU43143.1 HU family DNA-binding protein [Pirellulales bacterium]